MIDTLMRRVTKVAATTSEDEFKRADVKLNALEKQALLVRMARAHIEPTRVRVRKQHGH